MTSIEKKIKLEEQTLPKFMTLLKDRQFSNVDAVKIKDSTIEQMEESIFNTSQLWIELDENKDGIMDFLEEDRLKYIFDGLPITKPIKQYFSKIEQYFYTSERQKEKLAKKLMDALDYLDKTREIVKLIPVESTQLGEEEVERFKTRIKGTILAYKEEKTKPGRGILLEELRRLATTDEKKVWVNSIALIELGEEILK